MTPHSVVFLLIHLWAAMQDVSGLAVPLMEQDELELPLPKETRFRTRARTRTRRCACSNQLDSECHYFCHLDIIWVNTPSKKTLDGLGSPLARRRRSASRCACASPADKTCSVFCRNSLEQSSSNRSKIHRPNPLSILRAAVGAARSFQDAVNPEGREDAGVWVENA